MTDFLKKIGVWLLSIISIIALFSFLPISKEYVYHKFEETEYNKINWFLQKAESGHFKDKQYKGVFLGSSQCYYGINDSILGPDYLNLGMNTPSRDLDLFMYSKFKEAGGKADSLYIAFDGQRIVSYGIHPLMPYLVSPNWMLNRGQSLWSLHFWKFVIIRAQKSISALLYSYGNHKEFNRLYGVGYLNHRINPKRKANNENIKGVVLNKYNEEERVTFWDEFRHNIKSQWRFINSKITRENTVIILLPGFSSKGNYIQTTQNAHSIPWIKAQKYLAIESFGKWVSNPVYWADPGHMNKDGAEKYSKRLKIKFEKNKD